MLCCRLIGNARSAAGETCTFAKSFDFAAQFAKQAFSRSLRRTTWGIIILVVVAICSSDPLVQWTSPGVGTATGAPVASLLSSVVTLVYVPKRSSAIVLWSLLSGYGTKRSSPAWVGSATRSPPSLPPSGPLLQSILCIEITFLQLCSCLLPPPSFKLLTMELSLTSVELCFALRKHCPCAIFYEPSE